MKYQYETHRDPNIAKAASKLNNLIAKDEAVRKRPSAKLITPLLSNAIMVPVNAAVTEIEKLFPFFSATAKGPMKEHTDIDTIINDVKFDDPEILNAIKASRNDPVPAIAADVAGCSSFSKLLSFIVCYHLFESIIEFCNISNIV